jgi:hypothetical protein
MTAHWLSSFVATQPTLAFDGGRFAEGEKLTSAIARLAAYVVSVFCLAAIGCSRQANAIQMAAPSANQKAVNTGAEQGGIIPRLQILPASEQHSNRPRVQSIDLGTIRQGERLGHAIIIENRTSELVTIDRFDSSCECLTLTGLPLTIPARGNETLNVLADASSDDGFHGDLAIDLKFFAAGDRVLHCLAYLTVRSKERAGSNATLSSDSNGDGVM